MSNRSLALTLVAALFALFGFSTSASAAPSDFDKTFANGGIALPNFGGFAVPTGSVVQPDGKILVVGTSFGTPTARDYRQLVARFNQDGTFDAGFGSGGVVLTDYEAVVTNIEYGTSIIVLADGRIVTTGLAGGAEDGSDAPQDSTVTRFLANGAPDTTFGPTNNGKLRLGLGDSGTKDYARKVIPAAGDGLFVTGGAFRTPDQDAYLIKLTSAGALDTSFSGDGIAYADFPAGGGENNDEGVDLAQLSTGTVAVLSKCDLAGDENCAAVRGIDPIDGSTDVGFAVGGTLKFSTGEYATLLGMIVQASGRIVVANNPESPGSLKLRGLKPDATALDPTFGIAGESEVTLPGESLHLEGIAKTSDGGVLAVGRRQANPGGAAFVRTTTNGAGLSTFGTNGAVIIPATPGLTLTTAAVQADGRYFAAGYNDAFGGNALVRLIGDGPEPVAPPAPVALSTKIKSPSKSKLKASKLKSIAGTAAGTGLVKVKLAIQRIDSKLLKKSKRCLFVTSSKGKTKKYKPVKKKCSPTKYLTAKGTTNWSYKIKLKPGKYKLFLVGVGDGARVGKTTTKTFTLTK